MKVAILGLSPSTRDQAPWDDLSWQLWGLGWDPERYCLHRAFEMHDAKDINLLPDCESHLRMMEGLTCLYMAEPFLPGAIQYPFEEVARDVGAYWCSSIAYMLSLAIHEGAEEIGLWGVDMKANEEYAYQRPNCEYLIGLARGRGIKVHIPQESPLCKFASHFDYDGRYGRRK